MQSLTQIHNNTKLYIVPTPIGNLQDITYRALSILKKVSYIIAENNKRTKTLLHSFSIKSSLYIINRYNENLQVPKLIKKLQEGYDMALISDSGSPLINDPGYRLVQSCHQKNIQIIPLPGPCAAITALCGSGLPTNRFCFEGFLPSKQTARKNRLHMLINESRTLIFYDVKHRIIDSLKDMISVFGPNRYVVIARELSKIWESIHGSPLNQLLYWVQKDKKRIQGEIVLIVSGNDNKNNKLTPKIINTMQLLISELSLKKAAILVGYIYGIKKNLLYQHFLNKKNKNHNFNTTRYSYK